MNEFKAYSESPIARLYYAETMNLTDEESRELFAGMTKYNELLTGLLDTLGNEALAQSIHNLSNMASEAGEIAAFKLGMKRAALYSEILARNM